MLRIDARAAPLAREFKSAPLGPYSADLQKLLLLLRWGVPRGRAVIVCTVPHREWRLARMGEARGSRMSLGTEVFTSHEAASWACFRARWREVAGEDCPVA